MVCPASKSESDPSFGGICSDLARRISRTCCARGFDALPAIHDEIGARALFGIRHLLGQQRLRTSPRSCPAAPARARAAISGRRRHHHHRVAALVAAGLEQQRNVEHRDRGARRARPRARKRSSACAHQRMHDGLQPLASPPASPSTRWPSLARSTLPPRGGARKRRLDQRHRLALIEPCTAASASCTGTPSSANIFAVVGLAHADRAGEAEDDHGRSLPPTNPLFAAETRAAAAAAGRGW